jgi:RNA polymerase sigma factor (sigma-70 family)
MPGPHSHGRQAFAPARIECRLDAPGGTGADAVTIVGEPDQNNVDDKALMLRFQEQGDLPAFERLFARHRRPLLGYLRRLSRSADLAEEVSQHAWLKVIESARSAHFNATLANTFSTWLYTLARNYYVDRYVRAHEVKRRAPETEAELAAEAGDMDRGADRDRVGRLLQTAIDCLPFEQREVVLLWAHGHDLTAIAEICGSPWATIVSRKKYALARLRSELRVLGIAAGDT